jgi:HEAT repeat protein
VRCQAATGLGAIGASDAIPALCAALSDDAWWVRFNAASALAELGPAGRAALVEQAGSDEAQRRSVARYVLERSGLESLAA